MRAGGRPPGPSSATEYAVLSHGWRILADEGLPALTPMRLHRETGVARTTIYRHWPDTGALVRALVERPSRARPAAGSGDDIVADLTAAIEALLATLERRPAARLIGALLAADASSGLDAGDQPSAGEYVSALLAPVQEVVAAGCRVGALASAPDDDGAGAHVDRLVAELVGPMLMRVVMFGERPTGFDAAEMAADFVRRWAA